MEFLVDNREILTVHVNQKIAQKCYTASLRAVNQPEKKKWEVRGRVVQVVAWWP